MDKKAGKTSIYNHSASIKIIIYAVKDKSSE
jgi:hypothetical protein